MQEGNTDAARDMSLRAPITDGQSLHAVTVLFKVRKLLQGLLGSGLTEAVEGG